MELREEVREVKAELETLAGLGVAEKKDVEDMEELAVALEELAEAELALSWEDWVPQMVLEL